MKYLMLVTADPASPPTAEQLRTIPADTQAWLDEVERRGIRLTGDRLQPVSDATTVRVRNAETLVVDGPFAETKEHIGGFDILECADLDEAIEVASKHPVAAFGALELRPFWQN